MLPGKIFRSWKPVSLAMTACAVLGVAHPSLADNQLAFRTPAGAVSIPVGQTKNLGVVDVSPYQKIRIVADERWDSASNVLIRLTFIEFYRAGNRAVSTAAEEARFLSVFASIGVLL
jgi:hypothetical protein